MATDHRFIATQNEGLSPLGLSGFCTSSTTLHFGVNAQGNGCGVYGESMGIGVGADRMPPMPVGQENVHTGVCGSGRTLGVFGIGGQVAGVFGEVPAPLGTGVIGLGKTTATGVLGASYDSATTEHHPFSSGTGVK